MGNPTQYVLDDVFGERNRQDDKWGQQNHDASLWACILVEEVGEFAKEVLRDRFDTDATANLRKEAIQIAAVAVAIVEWIDRGRPVVIGGVLAPSVKPRVEDGITATVKKG